MGISLAGSGCGCKKDVFHEGNPDPKNFKVESVLRLNGFAIVQVNYPDCKNFRGKKILVFEAADAVNIEHTSWLDPHFCEGDHPSPVARFEPTDKGVKLAMRLVLGEKA